ncbi:MAG: hypothetical protein SNJ55_08770 [Chloroherpetonaceae bacterium]
MRTISLLLVLLWGCQSDEIRLNEDDERFAALYADILLVHADYERVGGNGGAFSKSDSLQKIFSFHRVSSEQFTAQFARYKDDPALWLKVQDRALSLLGKHRELSRQETSTPPTSTFNPKGDE